MTSLNLWLHLPCLGSQGKCWVFRESPPEKGEKGNKSGGAAAPKEEITFIDIQSLGAAIRQEMNLGQASVSAIREYIFLCLFLGNDFLPHFPATNIRTHGIASLLEVYKAAGLGLNLQRLFIHSSTGKIQWTEVRRFIDYCAGMEHEWLLQEYEVRRKMQKSLVLDPNKPTEWTDNAPILLRETELYINPFCGGWRNRYYESLFPEATGTDLTRTICEITTNYLEGLQWVWSYYHFGCPDWQWQYRHHYPPLWSDLSKYFEIPAEPKGRQPFTPQQQLEYIMPPKAGPGLPLELKYEWAYCRYLWEAHLVRMPKT